MEIDKISNIILKRKTLDQIYCMLKEKKSISDPLYKSTMMYQNIWINTIGNTLGGPNVNLQSVSALPNVVSPFINSTIENNITTNQAFSYFSGGNFNDDNLVSEAHQSNGTYNGSIIRNTMLNLVFPEPSQPNSSANIDLDSGDDW